MHLPALLPLYPPFAHTRLFCHPLTHVWFVYCWFCCSPTRFIFFFVCPFYFRRLRLYVAGRLRHGYAVYLPFWLPAFTTTWFGCGSARYCEHVRVVTRLHRAFARSPRHAVSHAFTRSYLRSFICLFTVVTGLFPPRLPLVWFIPAVTFADWFTLRCLPFTRLHCPFAHLRSLPFTRIRFPLPHTDVPHRTLYHAVYHTPVTTRCYAPFTTDTLRSCYG